MITAARFTGVATTDCLSRTTNLPTITGFTVMGWFRAAVDTGATQDACVFGTTGGNAYFLQRNIGGLFAIYNGVGAVTGSAIAIQRWVHLAYTCAGTGAGQVLGYLNGNLDITQNGNAGITATLLRIGGGGVGYDERVNGFMADVKIYDAVLTQAEIDREMRQYALFRTANLNTELKMLTAATAITDTSGNGFDMTLAGTMVDDAGPPIPVVDSTRFAIPLRPAIFRPGIAR